jgi:hypothetical protein
MKMMVKMINRKAETSVDTWMDGWYGWMDGWIVNKAQEFPRGD